MTYDYKQAVDELLDAIRTHLQHQHGQEPITGATHSSSSLTNRSARANAASVKPAASAAT
jgi:hypothetical protein